MRALPLAILVLLSAGCTTPAPQEEPQGPTPPARAVYAADCRIASADWPEPCLAWASRNPSPSKTEIDIAVNPLDPRNVVVSSKDLDREASDCVWAVPQVSKDGGKTWTTVYVGGKKTERLPGQPLFGWACVTDPIMAFDKEGWLYYTLQAYDLGAQWPLPVGDSGSTMLLARSKDGGESWDKIIPLHAGEGTAVYHDYIRMASNPKTGSVYSVWNQVSVATGVPVLVATRDRGETAAPPVYLPVPDSPAGGFQSAVAAASDGTVYVVVRGFDPAGGAQGAYLLASADDAQTFGAPVRMFSYTPVNGIPNAQYRVGTFVELAVDNSGGERDGCLFAAWADGAKGEGDADILLARSCDEGQTWSEPARVNVDNTKSDQFMPRVVVDAEGVVLVTYMTRAYDPDNTLVDGEIAYSSDGGATWTAKRLTARSFDGDKGVHQNGSPFLGDYIGIASAGGRTYASFPTTVTGKAEIAVAAVGPSE